jgi:hypothetical protein
MDRWPLGAKTIGGRTVSDSIRQLPIEQVERVAVSFGNRKLG